MHINFVLSQLNATACTRQSLLTLFCSVINLGDCVQVAVFHYIYFAKMFWACPLLLVLGICVIEFAHLVVSGAHVSMPVVEERVA